MTALFDEYSPWKASHFPERIDLLKKGELIPPVHLQIALTNACNHSCCYCYVSEQNKCDEKLDTQVLLELLKDAKDIGVKAITLAGGGEPTVHKDFYVITRKIRELGLELGVFTNGARLDVDELSFATWIRISLDSFDTETYQSIRKSKMPDFEPIYRLCNETNVVVGASLVITQYNYNQIYDFALKSKEIGFDYVWLNPVQLPEHPDILAPYWGEVEEQLVKVKELSSPKFKVFCPKSRVGAQGILHKPFEKCILQQFTAFIWTNGNIYPCCETQGIPGYAVGNIYNGRFKDVWFSRSPLEVKDCNFPCLRRDKNIFMNYLIDKDAPHRNFI